MSGVKRRRSEPAEMPDDGTGKRYSKDKWNKFHSRMAYLNSKKHGFPRDSYITFHTRNDASRAKYGLSKKTADDAQLMNRAQDRMIGRGRYRRAAFGRGMYYGPSRMRGRGAYELDSVPMADVDPDVLMGQYTEPPSFQSSSLEHDAGGLVLTHREFVQQIYGNPSGSTFVSSNFDVQPGLASLFPMLSQFAGNFKRYELISCVFHFNSHLDAGVLQSSTGQVGDICMFSHQDPTAPDFESAAEFQMNGGKKAPVTRDLICGVECSPTQLRGLANEGINIIRTGPITGKSHYQEYDQAKFQLAVSNTTAEMADKPLGDLFVSYKVRLIEPRISSMKSRTQLVDKFVGYDLTAVDCAVGDKWHLYSSSLTALDVNNIGSTAVVTTPTDRSEAQTLTITFPDWLQGLIKITLTTETFDEPDGNAEINDVGINWNLITSAGEVAGVNFNPELNSSGTLSPTNNYQVMGIKRNDVDGGGAVGTAVAYFRVGQAETEANAVTFEVNSIVRDAGVTESYKVKSELTIEVVQDYNSTGTQALSSVAALAES